MLNRLQGPAGTVHHGRPPDRVGAGGETVYYDVPMLKKPVWSWEIPAYFFLGGLSSGAYMLSRASALAGEKLEAITRTATFVSLAAILPSAPLLIMDLGDSRRFHHMLRVFKPHSPMSVGSWVLSGYSGIAALASLREWLAMRAEPADRRSRADGLARTADRVENLVGVPLAGMLATYTGVLLSCTATPVWTRNTWLPVVFATGGFHNGTSAVGLALEASTDDPRLHGALEMIDVGGAMLESLAIGGYLASAARYATPMTRGQLRPVFWGGAVGFGLVLPAMIRGAARLMGKPRWMRVAANALSVVGGMALRWAVLRAGEISGADPEAAREASRGPAP